MQKQEKITLDEITNHIFTKHNNSNVPNAVWAFNFCVKHTDCVICNKYMCEH